MPQGRSNPKGRPPASELTRTSPAGELTGAVTERLRQLSPGAWVAIGGAIVVIALFVKGPDEGPPRLKPAPPATAPPPVPGIGTAGVPGIGTAGVPGIGTGSIPGIGTVTPTSLGAPTPGPTALSATGAGDRQPGNVRGP